MPVHACSYPENDAETRAGIFAHAAALSCTDLEARLSAAVNDLRHCLAQVEAQIEAHNGPYEDKIVELFARTYWFVVNHRTISEFQPRDLVTPIPHVAVRFLDVIEHELRLVVLKLARQCDNDDQQACWEATMLTGLLVSLMVSPGGWCQCMTLEDVRHRARELAQPILRVRF
jgi:hypothetical protein